MEKIKKYLKKSNPWWEKEFTLDYKPRKIYPEINKYIAQKQIVALTGLRRVGKTTLMFKIVKDYLKKFKRKNIVYFSFDEFRKLRIEKILESYYELKGKGKDILCLFDEIQKVENWQEQMKRLYDENPHIKFVISGSESLFIRKNSRESLAGRMYEFKIKPLNFKEYLDFKGKDFENIKLYKKEVLDEFRNYLFTSGFPEVIGQEREIQQRYIKETVIEKIIYRDIPQIFPIEDPDILNQIFKIIFKKPGQRIEFNKLADELNISRQTVSLYLNYLEKSFLIKKLYNFSKNLRKSERKLRKYYPCIYSSEAINDSFGDIFETFNVLELDAEFFWRDSQKHEVDVVKKEDDKIIPVEIKSGKIDTNSIKVFMKKFDVKRGKVITYDTREELESIDVVPFYEYHLKKL